MVNRGYLFLHLTGVVLLFAGFTASLFLKRSSERSGDATIVAYVFSMITFNDKWFTPASILLILAGGFGAAREVGLSVTATGWILWSLVLFGISGLIFVFRTLPLQRDIENCLREAQSETVLDEQNYQSLSRSWKLWANTAFVLLVAAFALMVMQPPTFLLPGW